MTRREGIPVGTVYRLMKPHIGDHKLSVEAVEYLKIKLDEFIEEVTKKAVKAAEHAKRKTIRAEDIKMALAE